MRSKRVKSNDLVEEFSTLEELRARKEDIADRMNSTICEFAQSLQQVFGWLNETLPQCAANTLRGMDTSLESLQELLGGNCEKMRHLEQASAMSSTYLQSLCHPIEEAVTKLDSNE